MQENDGTEDASSHYGHQEQALGRVQRRREWLPLTIATAHFHAFLSLILWFFLSLRASLFICNRFFLFIAQPLSPLPSIVIPVSIASPKVA